MQTWNFVFSKWLMGYDKDFSKDFVKMIAEFVEAKYGLNLVQANKFRVSVY